MILHYIDPSAWVKRYSEEDSLLFVASDHELKEAARSAGLTVIDPEEQ